IEYAKWSFARAEDIAELDSAELRQAVFASGADAHATVPPSDAHAEDDSVPDAQHLLARDHCSGDLPDAISSADIATAGDADMSTFDDADDDIARWFPDKPASVDSVEADDPKKAGAGTAWPTTTNAASHDDPAEPDENEGA